MVTLRDGISTVTAFASDAFDRLSSNPTATAVGGTVIGATLVGAGAVAVAARKKTRRKNSIKKRRTTRTARKRKPAKRKASKRKRTKPRTAGKRRDTSTRRIRIAKNGQPYITLANGRTRFISKKSARISRKRKGGRY